MNHYLSNLVQEYGYKSVKDFMTEYMELLLEGRLNAYLYDIDEACYTRMELLTEQMKTGAGITEELKRNDQMKWVGLMNNVRNAAEEIILKEIVYG